MRLIGVLVLAVAPIAGCTTLSNSAPPVPTLETMRADTTQTMKMMTRTTASESGATPHSGNDTHHEWITITPLTSLASSFRIDPGKRFSNAYTRLVVTGNVSGATESDTEVPLHASTDGATGNTCGPMGYHERNALARYLAGIHSTVNLTVKVTVGPFTATVPLVTIDHTSNSADGEGFSRAVYHRAENYPLFLVRRDGSSSIVSMQYVVKANDQYQSNAGGTALQVAQTVAKYVSPQSAVLTTLTQQTTRDMAAALDNAVSKLFATTIDEEQWLDKDIRYWNDWSGATVTFKMPSDGNLRGGSAACAIGQWTVTFANPRPSIFSDLQICQPLMGSGVQDSRCAVDFETAAKAVQDEVKPEEVLSFVLVNGAQGLGSVASYLKQQDWYASALRDVANAGGDANKIKMSAEQFCRSVKESVATLNLNAVDAGIVVVAARDGLPLPQLLTNAMREDADNCGWAYKK